MAWNVQNEVAAVTANVRGGKRVDASIVDFGNGGAYLDVRTYPKGFERSKDGWQIDLTDNEAKAEVHAFAKALMDATKPSKKYS